ncbi:MAG: alkaline phosphatase family protein [Candidatus Sedimenticola sp. (ex Thyasira tokunagai)]
MKPEGVMGFDTPQIRKVLFVILDGVGDRPCGALGGATPLGAASLPNLNRLARQGVCGLMDPIAPGITVATHTGTALLMGLSRQRAERLARGPVEAVGIGIPLQPGDVAIRGNFSTLRSREGRLEILDRRAGRISEGADELAALLQRVDLGEGIRADLFPATQHRAVLRLSGEHLSSAISDSDPGGGGPNPLFIQPSKALRPGEREAERTAHALNRFLRIAYERLDGARLNQIRRVQGLTPANGIITRDAGKHEPLNSLVQHHQLKAAVVAGERTVIGLARLFGYEVRENPAFTALPDTDLGAKVAATGELLRGNDIVFLHIKGPDIAAHDKRPQEKKALLERIDTALVPLLDQGHVVAVTGDHATDSNTGVHCADPVPAMLFVPGRRGDTCRRFNERSCVDGGMGRITSTRFLLSTLETIGV